MRRFFLIVIISVFVLCTGSVLQIYPFYTPTTSALTLSDSDNIEQRKETILNITDAALQIIRNVKTNILANAKIANDVKQSLLVTLNSLEASITSYREQVNVVTSGDELRALNQQILQYFLQHKDDIRNSMRDAIVRIGERTTIAAEELQRNIETLLTILKVTCPQERDTINALEQQVSQLQQEAAQLRTAVQSRDSQSIKTRIANLSTLSSSIVDNVNKISAACVSQQ